MNTDTTTKPEALKVNPNKLLTTTWDLAKKNKFPASVIKDKPLRKAINKTVMKTVKRIHTLLGPQLFIEAATITMADYHEGNNERTVKKVADELEAHELYEQYSKQLMKDENGQSMMERMSILGPIIQATIHSLLKENSKGEQ